MHYLNLSMDYLEGEDYAGADFVDQAVAVALLKYCGKHENSGRITGARLWKSGKVERVLHVPHEVIHKGDGSLWTFEGNDLVVHYYPIEQEQRCITNRKNGKLGGRPRDLPQPTGKPTAKPTPNQPPKRKGKGKGKGKETPPSPPQGGPTTTDDLFIDPDDLDEYGPAPESDHPDPDPLWNRFLEERDPFERFDAFKNRIEGIAPPASN